MLTSLATALDAGDDPNPWPAGIADGMWWLTRRQLELEPGSIFAGIYADKPGFHNTVAHNQAQWPGNYSIALPILLEGPHDKARADDWEFPEAQSSTPDYTRINKYSARLLAASQARDPRLTGWYEWFGTNNGANIGYGIYKDRPSSSDDTHDWHIHKSAITAYVEDWRIYHGMLSVLMGETLEAFLARGGQLLEGTQDVGDTQITYNTGWIAQRTFLEDADQIVIPPNPAVRASGGTWPNLVKARAVRIEGKLDAIMATLAELKTVVAALANAGTSVSITNAQVSALAGQLGAALLAVEADADQARADALRHAAGS